MKNINFAVIDFETANSSKDSMCEVGVSIVRNGVIDKTYVNLILPPTGLTRFDNTYLHGITASMVYDEATTWNDVEPLVRSLIGDLPLVAHNANFDRNVYLSTSESVGIPVQADFEWIDSVIIARKFIGRGSLADACAHYQIPLDNHHRAGNDAEATAKLVLSVAEEFGIDDVRDMGGSMVEELTRSTEGVFGSSE